MRRSSWVLSGAAAVLLAASAVTRLAVYPAVHQLPSDTDSTFAYTGTASLLNAAALESGDLANAMLADVPVSVERHVQVVATDGGTAVVSDDVTVAGPDGTELSSTGHRWSVDRTDLDDRPVPDGEEAEEHQGLVISWPLEPEQQDYTFWDPTTASEVPAVFDRVEDVEGRETYVYVMSAAGPLADPDIAENLPAALPRDVLAGIAETLPAEQRPDPAALAALPDPVPLTYAATIERVAWIDTDTGAVLNGSLEQTIVAQTEGPDGPVTLAPVNTMAIEGTPEGIADRADDAADDARALWLVGFLLPLVLLVLAVLLAAFVVWREVRGRRGAAPAGGDPEPEPAS
ncbi:porin PorA family protein [Streptomyces sp. RFCAC02]|uniref:porin PorA family protein n=1 Tax=Streptomyces sp. RFCAC02 TaxID=2499143 RepID=UPI00101F18A7|nr:porin PorA family protein [Streptomyces sp. RFCAC02]